MQTPERMELWECITKDMEDNLWKNVSIAAWEVLQCATKVVHHLSQET